MDRSQNFFLLCFTFIILLSNIAHADCTNKGGGVWETADNTSEAINECITAASAGDTINVVAGDGAASWAANAVTIPVDKPLKLIGPGSDNLTINLTGHYVLIIAPYVGTDELPSARISGFKFVSPLDSKYAAILAKGQGWRIDHCAYESIESAISITAGLFVIPSGINTSIQPYGLIDNNLIKNGKIVTLGPFKFNYMSAVWADALGLGTANAVYVEDNEFSTDIDVNMYKRLAMDANYGGKFVFRYNTCMHVEVGCHGLQTDDSRGTRKWEFYGNDFNSLDSSYTHVIINLKAGTGVIFCNADTSPDAGEAFDTFITLQHERSDISIGDAGLCSDGNHWDGSLDATGWPCRDQIGVGTDAYQWVSSPAANPAPTQTLTPAYFWSNIDRSGAFPSPTLYSNAGTHIKANRDYYTHNTSFDGTSGLGCGTLANRPATCTVGVAYWATDQSCTDLTGMVGANPTTPITGTLYKCTSTNTWTAYYKPYTYPHPLRTVPQNLQVVLPPK